MVERMKFVGLLDGESDGIFHDHFNSGHELLKQVREDVFFGKRYVNWPRSWNFSLKRWKKKL